MGRMNSYAVIPVTVECDNLGPRDLDSVRFSKGSRAHRVRDCQSFADVAPASSCGTAGCELAVNQHPSSNRYAPD